MKELFSGSCVALITPFKKNKIDYKKLEEILDFQKLAGTDAILILGTTGESPTITFSERQKMISFCRARVFGKTKLLVGTGSNSTQNAIKLSKNAEKLGADGLLIVTPYYNKCTQEGLLKHYEEIAKNVNIPIILYNVPSRTCVNIEPETAEKLSKIKNIVGIKEASSNKEHIDKTFDTIKDEIAIYSGNDDLNSYFLKKGGRGVISVTANIFPELVKQECDLFFDGQVEEGETLQQKLCGINKAMFIETNPIPVKYGASYLNLCENELRLPLTSLRPENEAFVEKEIDKLK